MTEINNDGIELPYITFRDDTLTHQVRFVIRNRVVHVGCICRTKPGTSEYVNDGSRSLDMIGPTKNIDESRTLYNDPSNHWAPFTEEDKAKW